MKKLILSGMCMAFMLTSYITQAQFSLGVRGGLSVPNLSAGGGNETPLNTGYSSRLGADAGIFATFKITRVFSIQPMIEYSSQGGKKDGLQALTTPEAISVMYPPGQAPDYLYANYNSEAKLNYLLIPLLAKFGWNLKKTSPLRFYADAGPFVGFLLSAKQVTSGQSQVYTDPQGHEALPVGPQSFDNNENIKSQLNKRNYGVEANVGLDYHLAKNNVFLEVGGNYGFTNIQKGTINGKNNTGAATVTAGYTYSFGK